MSDSSVISGKRSEELLRVVRSKPRGKRGDRSDKGMLKLLPEYLSSQMKKISSRNGHSAKLLRSEMCTIVFYGTYVEEGLQTCSTTSAFAEINAYRVCR